MNDELRHKLEIPDNISGRIREKLQNSFGRLLLSFVGGTFVWALWLTFVYGVNSLTCEWAWFAESPERTGLKIAQVVATLIAAASILYFGFVANREWRHLRAEGRSEESESIAARDTMLGFVTLLVNLLYLLIILVSFVPIFVLPACS
jgi:hypothetical protein